MKQATTTLIGGLAILLAPSAMAQIDGDASPSQQDSERGVEYAASGVLLPNIQRDPLPVSRPAMGRVAERVLVTPTRSGEESALPGDSLADQVIHDRLYFDVAPDGTIWVRGADFKASAGENGFSYIPFLGSHVPRNFPVDFRLVEATRSGEALALSASAGVQRQGNRVVLDRGDVEVRYDIALHSVEQSFALQIPAGVGDLVLTLAVETDLGCDVNGGGFEFRGEHGGVSYGSVIVIDADGQTTDVEATWTGEGIQLSVPGGFLDGATGPIVIDPIFSTITIDDFSAELTNPDMAYDAMGDQYCIVYEEVFSGGDVDVYSQFVAAGNGTTSDGAYFDSTADDWTLPRVAAQQNDSVFFLVATSDGAVAGSPDIVARTRSAIDGSLAPAFVLKGHNSSYNCHLPDIGGDNFASSSSYFCVVYNRDYGTDNDVAAIIVDVNGSWSGAGEITLATAVSRNELAPAVSKSTGSTMGTTRFNIAWANTEVATGDGGVDACQLSFDGNTVIGPFQVEPTLTGRSFFDVEVSCQSDVNHLGSQVWLVTYDDGPSSVTDAFVSMFADDVHMSTVELTRSEHANVSLNQDNLVVGTHADHFALGYQEGSSQYVSIVQVVGTQIGITERRLPIPAPDPAFASLTVATVFEGGGPFVDGMFAWSDVAGGDADILAARYEPDGMLQAAGYQYCYGAANSTGDRGFIQAFGDRSVTSGHTLVVSGLPGAFGFCLASQTTGFAPGVGGSLGTLCLGGSIGRFGIYNTSGTMGTATIPVNPLAIAQPTGAVSAMSGQTWNFQSWHRDSVGGAAVSNFTNAVALPFL